ncbi:MAG: signal peptide peptidase SppA, partial [Spirochaetes bacterium]|nr:signal peptide peptidase SppA [Spirochaetota bacterium]
NIYQLSLEPLEGLFLEMCYFDLKDDQRLLSGIKIRFPNLGVKYYNSNKYAHNHNWEFSYHSGTYKTFFTIPNKVTEIKISGLLTDTEQFSFFGDISQGAQKILEDLKKCYEDDSIKGIILNIGSITTTSYGGIGGLVYEIREKIIKLKQKDKFIVAYLEVGGSTEEYFLASAANRIVLSPYASLEGLGVSVNVLKLKGLLDRFGIGFEVVQSGKNKNALNPFTKDIKEEQKKKIRDSVEDSFNLFTLAISEDRLIDEEEIRSLINEYPILDADILKENHWIDHIGYKEKAYDIMALLLNKRRIYSFQEVDTGSLHYLKKEWRKGPVIAIVSIYGPIITGKSIFNPLYGNLATGAESIIKQLKDVEGNPHIKGVILRIDSPGGSVIASDMIYEQILKLREAGKYVVASLGGIAASGGYYIACGADHIVSTPYTLTGSIGVFTMKLELSGLFKKYDIKSTTIKKGPYSDIFSWDRKLTKDEREKMEASLNKIHTRFKNIIHQNRKIDNDELDLIADGSIFTGNQAKKINLVDQLGGTTAAIEWIKKKFNMDDPYFIYYWKDVKSSSPIKLGTSFFHF